MQSPRLMFNPYTSRRDAAAVFVAQNFRIRKRLPRITWHAIKVGLVTLTDIVTTSGIQITPCLALKAEGDPNWWSAGVMTYDKSTRTNYIPAGKLAFASTPLEAAYKASNL